MSDFADRARAEAERRWPGPNIVMPSGWHEKGMVSGFVLGALWAAKQEPSDAVRADRAEAERDRLQAIVERITEMCRDTGNSSTGPTYALCADVMAALNGEDVTA